MKKLLLLTIVILFISAVSFSQTKRIAHLSHSGSITSFTTSGSGNFGLSEEAKREREKKRNGDAVVMRVDTLVRNGVDTIQKVIPRPSKKQVKKKAVKH